jgi:very-short-patch-repair endonuclease
MYQTKEVKNNDKLRDEFLQTLNLKIVRFINNEVCKNGDSIVKKLRAVIDSLTKRSFPLKFGDVFPFWG